MEAYYSTIFLFLFFNFFLTSSQNLNLSNSCEKNSNSTSCLVQKPRITETCIEYEKNLLTVSEKNFILNFHTNLRKSVQGGKEKLPKAFFMKKLYWSEILEQMAQKWADKCAAGKDPNLGKIVGQNVIAVNKKTHQDIKSLIEIWATGLKNLTDGLIAKYRKPKLGEINYEPVTQMIWWNTTELGCGRSIYNITNCTSGTNITENCTRERVVKLVCNYSPAGNKEGEPVYINTENNNLICQYDDKDILCKNISSKNKTTLSKNNSHKVSLIDRIKNRMNGIWPAVGRGTSITGNSYIILFLLLISYTLFGTPFSDA